MNSMNQLLGNVGIDTSQSILLTKVFLLVLAVLLFNFVVRRIFVRLAVQLKKTENEWDDALLDAARKPLAWGVWVLGIAWVVGIVSHAFDADTLSFVASLRDTLLIVLVSWFLVRLVSVVVSTLARPGKHRDAWDKTTVEAMGKLVKAAVVITAILALMQHFGFSISGVLAFGGVGGIAIGFAAKDLLSNFFGGLMIYLDRQFSVGDWIRSPDKEIEGTVEYIGWRITRIRTFDMRPLYVPNATFTSISVENPSRMHNRRFYETFGLRYEDQDKVQAITVAVKEMLLAHAAIDTQQTLMVNVNTFNSHSVDFFVYSFTKTTKWAEFHEIKQQLLGLISDIVALHGADFAFPTQTIHLMPQQVMDTNGS
ncbi:mechanosensitive ion channel family protein [Candidatus Njordibacter sp. Uisw_039]|jgi:MscS family membrane protein|uniref:mechanosensitive ion channel family protein n=1 Tax=Candidatus Njordibacter sp. Uisw_039 TaxID=3230972 RepID=UPI003D549F9B|tara:strand:- start:2340 stop:3443 length:1104 start_codon:yes stop_codon:yes gene_type:complete